MTGYYDQCPACSALILVSAERAPQSTMPCPQCAASVTLQGAGAQARCEPCRKPIAVAASLRGTTVFCPDCLGEVAIPAADPAPSAPAPAPASNSLPTPSPGPEPLPAPAQPAAPAPAPSFRPPAMPSSTATAPSPAAAAATETPKLATDDPPVRTKIRLKPPGSLPSSPAVSAVLDTGAPVAPRPASEPPPVPQWAIDQARPVPEPKPARRFPGRWLLLLGLGLVVVAGGLIYRSDWGQNLLRRHRDPTPPPATQPVAPRPVPSVKAPKPKRPAQPAVRPTAEVPAVPPLAPAVPSEDPALVTQRERIQAQIDRQYPLAQVGQNLTLRLKGGLSHQGTLTKLQPASVMLKIQYGELEIILADLQHESRLRVDHVYRGQFIENELKR